MYLLGQIKNDLFHGIGTYLYENGEKFEGYFEEGKKSGFGVYYYSEAKINEKEKSTHDNSKNKIK